MNELPVQVDLDWNDLPSGENSPSEENSSEDVMEVEGHEQVSINEESDNEFDSEDSTETNNITDSESEEESEEIKAESDSRPDDEDASGEGGQPEETLDYKKSIEEGSLELSVPVDGEEVSVTLQELKNNYAGKVAWEKRFNEVDKARKEHAQEVDTLNNYVNTFRNKFEGDNGPLEAMKYLGELAGMPPYMVQNALLQSLHPEVVRRSQMSANELQSEQLQEQSAYLEQQRAAENERKGQEQAHQELLSQIDTIREQHSISTDEWLSALDELEGDDRFDPNSLTPEVVGEYITHSRAENLANEIASSVDESLLKDSNFMSNLDEVILSNPEFTKEDLVEMVTQTVKNAKEKEVKETVVERVEKKAPQIKKQKAPVKRQEENEFDIDWDDL